MHSMWWKWTRTGAPQERRAFRAAEGALGAAIVAVAMLCCHVIGDTSATLLVSQEIVRHGTIRLDGYDDAELARHGYAVVRRNGHAYDAFPLGTAVLSTPVVAVANLLGFDARVNADALQAVIAAGAILALAWLLFGLARLFLDPWPALALVALCVFGTSIASSGLVTLFSHDFAALAATAAIFHVVRGLRTQAPIHAAVVGTCLFLAYLCRPTMALLAPFLLPYLFAYRRTTAMKSAAWLAVLFAGFVLWSRHEYAQWLPDYYLPQRLQGGDFAHAAWQNLFGPARGLFVFSPFLAVVPPLALGVLLVRRNADHAFMLLVGLAWPLAHWLAISRLPHWWGGWSYGPRLMLDCLPGLFLALFHSLSLLAPRGRRAAGATITALGAFSVYVNVWQAFANPYPMHWNAKPNVDEYPEYLSDWRYPQFLYDATLHRRRMAEFERMLKFAADMPDAQFDGFSALRGDVRVNTGRIASLRLPPATVGRPEGRFVLAADVAGTHVLRVRLNGHVVDEATRSGPRLRVPIVFDRGWFVDGPNVVDFELTDAPDAVGAFAFRSLSVFPSP